MLFRLTLLVSILVHLPQNLLAVEDVIFKSGFEQTNILAAPTGLSADAVSMTRIDLRWTDNTDTESGFTIEHSPDNSNWSVETSLGANAETYTDTGLSPSTTHHYRVRAFDADTGLSSDWSNVADATTDEELPPPPPPDPPTAPSGLRATATSISSIGLSWIDNSNTETGFTIEHSLDNSNWSAETNVGANVTKYSDTGLSPLSKHYYRVRAFDASTSSSWSNTNSATTTSVAAPSGLVATVIDSQNIELTWVDNSNNETGFRIKRRVKLTGYITAGVVAANTTSFTSTNLNPNTLYIFQVYAYNADGDSIWSNTASATTPP